VASAARTGLWKNRNFRALLTAQTLSAFGDAFSYVAVPLLILHTTGSVLQMGVVTGLVGAASMLTGVFAGVIADRFDRRALLRICDVARCLIFASIPVVWAVGPQLWFLYLVLPLASAFSTVFQVAYVSLVPSLVPADQITAANGRLYGSYSTTYLIGPALAGVVSSRFGPSVAIAVDAASFALSALGIGFIRPTPAGDDAPAAEPHHAAGTFLAGAQFVWRHPVLRPLTALLAVLTFFTFGLNDVIIWVRIFSGWGVGRC
jgi:MFS family permease